MIVSPSTTRTTVPPANGDCPDACTHTTPATAMAAATTPTRIPGPERMPGRYGRSCAAWVTRCGESVPARSRDRLHPEATLHWGVRPMKILHLADTHLDRVFGAAEDRRDAARRRAGLRDALSRGARAPDGPTGVGAIVLAGDVYEHASVTADTVAFLAGELERAAVPVLVTPGNHDPYVAGSAWQLAEWPANVHVFAPTGSSPTSSATASSCGGRRSAAPTAPAGVPDGFRAPSDGRTHLLALHAALTGERWADEGRHRSVTRAQLEATNVARVLLGHFHDGYDDGRICYPGSPEPLGWGERHGDHGASIVTVSVDRSHRRHVPIADPPVRRAGRVGAGAPAPPTSRRWWQPRPPASRARASG